MEALVAPAWDLKLLTANLILLSFDKSARRKCRFVLCLGVKDPTASRSTLTLVSSQIICIPSGAVRLCPGRRLAVVNGRVHLSRRNWHWKR